MDMNNQLTNEEVVITKLVHGGQGLGVMADGKKVFVWNALPGELVRLRIIKQRRTYAEAVAEEVVRPSAERIAPREANYLATSPWQILTFAAENKYKGLIVSDVFRQAGVILPEFDVHWGSGKAAPVRAGSEAEFTSAGAMENPPGVFHYRNKMEYSFWGDDVGLHLALHQRGSHGKQIVQGSELAMPALDAAAESIRTLLEDMHIRAGDLKTIIVRCDQAGNTVAALFVKIEKFPEVRLPQSLKGLRVYYSNPKSPASVTTKLSHEYGDCRLEDTLLGRSFVYDVDSFFQVNVPVFEQALRRIAEYCQADAFTDMYAGVGSIALSIAKVAVDLIELDAATAAMARTNASKSGIEANVIETPAEKALEYITSGKSVIFDPPRAGLHNKVAAKVLEMKPPQVVYLSCNPATQARDIAKLQEVYAVGHFEVFNFFPRTPHIESLAVLGRKN